MARSLFTSESVSMGHPDKVSDQIASLIWSDTLSGWPIETDSEVKSERAMEESSDRERGEREG